MAYDVHGTYSVSLAWWRFLVKRTVSIIVVVSEQIKFIGQPGLAFRLCDSEENEHVVEAYRGSWLLLVLHRHLN